MVVGFTIILIFFLSWFFKWENENVQSNPIKNVPPKTLLGRFSNSLILLCGQAAAGIFICIFAIFICRFEGYLSMHMISNSLLGLFYTIPYNTKFPLRLVLGIWFMAIVVIITAYTSKLTSFLMVPKLKPIVNSFEDLAVSPYYKITAMANSAFSEMFLVNNSV